MAIQRYVPETVGDDPSEFLQGYHDNFTELMSFEPSAIITLYTLSYGETTYRFFPGNVEQAKDGKLTGFPFSKELIYDGEYYFPIPCEDEGFEASIGNKFPRPKFRISNVVNKFRNPNEGEEGTGYLSYHRFISTIMRSYNDLKDARLRRKRVFLRFLDGENFAGGENPFGIPNPFALIEDSAWVIYQKTSENKYYVEFELSSVFDVETAYTPARRLSCKFCSFDYRGDGCRYSGLPISDKNGDWFQYKNSKSKTYYDVKLRVSSPVAILEYDPTSSYKIGDCCYVSSEKTYCETLTNSEPEYVIDGANTDMVALRTYYVCIKANNALNVREPGKNTDYWLTDCCGKTLDDCRKRFGNTEAELYSDKQINYPLPFGGFPGINGTKYA